MSSKEYFNETTNTFAGITTPREREDHAATDPLNEIVEKTMDTIQQAFTGGNNEDRPTKAASGTDGRNEQHEPTVAPGMNTHDQLEQKATKRDVEQHDTTSVTRLYLDRTPED
ncbi:hypothetical protein DUZ99_13190 [Xylanibacillus composti]|uniref:Uncharacterized protein n=1 Tax=Xylanibacillus composti TaxID=1572762 RepID=A0A8J4M4H3_9BACL|nr:hypothetical protein [Xylanibacillus composti]MDT9725929.1 hypothetical protein [Xylanibacillus composti]GIQ71242.1 hypothetical protein XYCOK13_40660 [Xylanibacillus composti]